VSSSSSRAASKLSWQLLGAIGWRGHVGGVGSSSSRYGTVLQDVKGAVQEQWQLLGTADGHIHVGSEGVSSSSSGNGARAACPCSVSCCVCQRPQQTRRQQQPSWPHHTVCHCTMAD
jgi:hypothetical protein